MEEQIESCVSPDLVWAFWKRLHGSATGELQKGQIGLSKFPYQIIDVDEGESFSVLWKTFWVRLILTHTVQPARKGSVISYKVQIQGLFSVPVRWMLQNKIRTHLRLVLQSIVKELEACH